MCKKKKDNEMDIHKIQRYPLKSKCCPGSELPWLKFGLPECFLLITVIITSCSCTNYPADGNEDQEVV